MKAELCTFGGCEALAPRSSQEWIASRGGSHGSSVGQKIGSRDCNLIEENEVSHKPQGAGTSMWYVSPQGQN